MKAEGRNLKAESPKLEKHQAPSSNIQKSFIHQTPNFKDQTSEKLQPPSLNPEHLGAVLSLKLGVSLKFEV
jgi:hypothetical protein